MSLTSSSCGFSVARAHESCDASSMRFASLTAVAFAAFVAWSCSSDDANDFERDAGTGDGAASALDASGIDGATSADGASTPDAAGPPEGGTTDGGIVVPDAIAPGTRFALDFPSNVNGGDQSAPFVALQYDDPHLDGLPFAGPGNAGVTYMWRVKLRQQTGYYVTLWWATAASRRAHNTSAAIRIPRSATTRGRCSAGKSPHPRAATTSTRAQA